ncbi:hypothetical protein C7271_17780 [filamentous cyanobacterium CCP5]|nr:hypothetical protein C7271_17780 [filamentous cyanobacterium CCP5]
MAIDDSSTGRLRLHLFMMASFQEWARLWPIPGTDSPMSSATLRRRSTMKFLSMPFALGMSSLCLFSATQSPARARQFRDCPGRTWEIQFRDCKMVDFPPQPADEAAFDVS